MGTTGSMSCSRWRRPLLVCGKNLVHYAGQKRTRRCLLEETAREQGGTWKLASTAPVLCRLLAHTMYV